MLRIVSAVITIATSDTLSAAANIGFESAESQAREDFRDSQHVMGLEIPTIDSAIVYLQVATTLGGTYRRLLKADGSGDWNVATGVGNRMIFIDEAAPFSFFKIETSAAQSANRTFNLLIR